MNEDDSHCKRRAKEEGFCTQHCAMSTEMSLRVLKEYDEALYQQALDEEKVYNKMAEENGFQIRYEVFDTRNMTDEELLVEAKKMGI
jgi:hypothetical protein